MAGAASWVAIAQWAATAPQALGVCGPPPSASTFRRVLAAVDVTAVEAALTTWVIGRQTRARQQPPVGTTAAETRTVLAVDGKTLRGSKDAEGQHTKLVCVYDHAQRLVLTQAAVAGGDEVDAFTAALVTLPDLAGVLVTADALHCQRAPRTSWLPAAGTTCSPSRATSRCCVRPCCACRGRTPPVRVVAGPDTAAPSPARSRSSTWTARRPRSCSPTPAERSRSCAGDAWAPAGPR